MSANDSFAAVATNNAEQDEEKDLQSESLRKEKSENLESVLKHNFQEKAPDREVCQLRWCENSLPGPSWGNNPHQISENFSTITSYIVESQLKHVFQENVPDREVHQLITNYCNFKLAEIIKAATDCIKESGRLKFTVEDFKKGLKVCGENPDSLALNVRRRRRLVADDHKKCQNVIKRSWVPCVYIKETWLNRVHPCPGTINSLSPELKKYFKAASEILFSTDKDFINLVLNDLKMNKNIYPLTPFFINFFYECINRFKSDYVKLSLLLKMIDAVLRNKFIFFGHGSFLKTLALTLLKFVVSDLPLFDQGRDCWFVKDTVANLIDFILNMSKDQHLFFDALNFIQSVLLTFENSWNSHYGALAVLNSIGVLAIFLILPLYIDRFHEHVRTIFSSANQRRTDFHMVQGQIVKSYHILVNYYFKNEFKKPTFDSAHHFKSKGFLSHYLKDITVFPIISQSIFSDYFGEAILPSFPSLIFSSHSTLCKKRKTNKRKLKQRTNNN